MMSPASSWVACDENVFMMTGLLKKNKTFAIGSDRRLPFTISLFSQDNVIALECDILTV